MSKYQLRSELEQVLYNEMCSTCRSAKKCHEECETCEEYEEELEKELNKHMVNEYTDKEGNKYKYFKVEDLCGEMVCMNCPHYNKCSKNNEQDSCEDYMNKLAEPKKELKENERV